MSLNIHAIDAINLLFIPLMAMTAIAVFKQSHSIFDYELTRQDKILLQRLVLFLLLPLVVFCHELGHVFAINLFGGHVKEFHYAFVWGYVVPEGHFTPDQTVWLYFSGNLVQIVIGLIALLGALIASSPPIVALLVYLFLWSVGGTVILYALMSFTGLYGDWVAIYSTPAPHLVSVILLFHLLLVALVFYCIYGKVPRLWFIKKTQPQWNKQHQYLQEQVDNDPTAINWRNLSTSFYTVGLYADAQKCLTAAITKDPNNPDSFMIAGAIAAAAGKLPKANTYFLQAANQPETNQLLKAKAYLAAGKSHLQMKQYNLAFDEFKIASSFAPQLADPYFFAAFALDAMGKYSEADQEILICVKLNWLDDSLWKEASKRLKQIKPL